MTPGKDSFLVLLHAIQSSPPVIALAAVAVALGVVVAEVIDEALGNVEYPMDELDGKYDMVSTGVAEMDVGADSPCLGQCTGVGEDPWHRYEDGARR